MSNLALNRLSRFVAVLVLLFALATTTPNAFAQNDALFDGLDRQNIDSIFLAAPREITRPLLNVRKRIARGDWEEAVATLGGILADPNTEDYLIVSKTGVASSLLRRTQKILGAIPSEHRESYRVRYGTRAKKLLEQAIESNDIELLLDLTRKYFYTSAGYEASMLIGHLYLSEGKPAVAASFFSRIVETEEARSAYEPEASVLLAMSWMLANDSERAKTVLVDLKSVRPDDTIKVLGREVALFASDDDALNWLQELIGASSLAKNKFVSQWLMFRGNAARTGQSGSGFPLLSPKWIQPTIADPREEGIVNEQLNTMIAEGVSPAPSVQPLVVGDTVVMRSNEQVIGVDFATGKRLWAFPPRSRIDLDTGQDGLFDPSTSNRKLRIRQRLWLDTLYGQSASDGERVFLVPHPGLATDAAQYQRNRRRQQVAPNPNELRNFNELIAIDVNRQGALAWQVGGKTGLGEPELAGVFFLGAPLSYGGQLYCICQQEGLIKLVVLDPVTGKLQWSQQLANNENRVNFQRDPYRRLAGATPSCDNGLLVCPTAIGALVAIDLSTRSLLWGYDYSSGRRVVTASSKRGLKTDVGLEGLWRDFAVVISGGRVIYSPVELQELLSIDLYTGQPQKQLDRKDSLFIAGVENGQVILVGSDHVRGVDIYTNEEAWEISIGDYGITSGRGYIGDGNLFLPMSKKKIIKVDLAAAMRAGEEGEQKIISAVSTGMLLGNLVRYRGDVVTHGVDVVATFPQDEENRKAVEQRLTGKGDTEAAAESSHQLDFIRGQLMIQDGDLKGAISMLAKAYEKHPISRYERLLCEMIVELIEVDYEAGSRFAEKYDEILMRQQNEGYLAAKIYGLIANQEDRRALEILLRFIENRTGEKQTDFNDQGDFADRWVTVKATSIDVREYVYAESTGPQARQATEENVIRFRVDRWLAVQLGILFDQLLTKDNPAEAKELTDLITNSMLKFDFNDALAKYSHCRLFPLRAIRPRVRISLAKELQARRNYLRANHLLASVIDQTSLAGQQVVGQALIAQAAMLVEVGDFEFAQSILNRVDASKHFDTDIIESSSQLKRKIDQSTGGRQIVLRDRFLYDEDEKKRGPLASLTNHQWEPKITATLENDREADWSQSRSGEFGFVDHPRYHNLIFHFHQRTGWLRISDCLGRIFGEYSLNPDRSFHKKPSTSRMRLGVRNHLMLVNKGESVYLLNWFNILQGKNPLLWQGKTAESIRNGVGAVGMNTICVVKDNNILGLDWLTGELVWRRNNIASRANLISDDKQLTHFQGGLANVFDISSGRFQRAFRMQDEWGSLLRNVGHLSIYRARINPIPRTAGSEPDESDVVDDPFAKTSKTTYKSIQFTIVNMLTRSVIYKETFSEKARSKIFENKLAIVDRDGAFTLFDFKTQETLLSTTIDYEIPEGYRLHTLEVDRFNDDYLVRLNLKNNLGRDTLKIDGAVYNFYRIKAALTEGPVMMIDGKTGEALWRHPANIEKFELIDGQPKFGPVILFCRRVKRRDSDEQIDMQVIALSRSTGKLAGSYVFRNVDDEKNLTVSLSHGLASNRHVEGHQQTMQIGYQQRQLTLTFGQDNESPPQPTAFVSNENSIEIPKPVVVVPVELTTEDADRKAFENAAAKAAEDLKRLREEEAKILEAEMDLQPRNQQNVPLENGGGSKKAPQGG